MLESQSTATDILIDIGSDLRHIKMLFEECDVLIKRTTEINSSEEKIVQDTLEYSHRLMSSLQKMRDKCSSQMDFYKNNRGIMRIWIEFYLFNFDYFSI